MEIHQLGVRLKRDLSRQGMNTFLYSHNHFPLQFSSPLLIPFYSLRYFAAPRRETKSFIRNLTSRLTAIDRDLWRAQRTKIHLAELSRLAHQLHQLSISPEIRRIMGSWLPGLA
jgi:hypothetical protein